MNWGETAAAREAYCRLGGVCGPRGWKVSSVQGLSPAVPCLFPGCYEAVRFDLGSANGAGRTPRAHARCPNGHPHYAEDYVTYGTDREH